MNWTTPVPTPYLACDGRTIRPAHAQEPLKKARGPSEGVAAPSVQGEESLVNVVDSGAKGAALRERKTNGGLPGTGQLWAVVLAGGDGRRVAALTRGVAGESAPKQYCAFGSDEPLLRWALRRAAAIVPWSRILVVVTEHHRRYWQQTLSDLPPQNIIVQPSNRGTAAGILLPVLDIVLHRDRRRQDPGPACRPPRRLRGRPPESAANGRACRAPSERADRDVGHGE